MKPLASLLLAVSVVGCGTSSPDEVVSMPDLPMPDPPMPDEDMPSTDDPTAELYAPDQIPRFDLEIAPDQLSALATEPFVKIFVHGTFRYGDEVIENVGVRLKGSFGSFRTIDEKAAFKIKFDKFVPTQQFRGLREMTLNNAMDDGSFITERVVYHAFRQAGLPAPRANNAVLYLNGEFYGVYVNVETEDKLFLDRWFASSEGNLYEQRDYQDWYPEYVDGFELETNEDVGDTSDLLALFTAIQEASDRTLLDDIGHVLHTEQFLAYCALEGIVNQWDGLVYGLNNYRMYHDPSTDKFTTLPWGMDMALKPLDWGGNYQEHIDIYQPANNLVERCIESSTCKSELDRVLVESLGRFEAMELPSLARRMADQVREHVYADQRKNVSNRQFEEKVETVIRFLEERPDIVRAQIEAWQP